MKFINHRRKNKIVIYSLWSLIFDASRVGVSISIKWIMSPHHVLSSFVSVREFMDCGPTGTRSEKLPPGSDLSSGISEYPGDDGPWMKRSRLQLVRYSIQKDGNGRITTINFGSLILCPLHVLHMLNLLISCGRRRSVCDCNWGWHPDETQKLSVSQCQLMIPVQSIWRECIIIISLHPH